MLACKQQVFDSEVYMFVKKKIVSPRIYRKTFDLPLLALSKPLTALNSINYWFQKHNFPQKKSNLMAVLVECARMPVEINAVLVVFS